MRVAGVQVANVAETNVDMLCASRATKGQKGDCWDGNAVSIMSDGVRSWTIHHRIYVTYSNIVEIMATFTLAISVFEPLGKTNKAWARDSRISRRNILGVYPASHRW